MNDASELRSAGLKSTQPRLWVLEAFRASEKKHLSADDVYRALVSGHRDIGLSTVYRVLSQLTTATLLKKHQVASEAGAVYELDKGDHHDHCVCLDCGHIDEFRDAQIEALQEKVAAQKGFRLVAHSLVMYRRCSTANCPHRPARMA